MWLILSAVKLFIELGNICHKSQQVTVTLLPENNARMKNLDNHVKDTVDISEPISNGFDMLAGAVGWAELGISSSP